MNEEAISIGEDYWEKLMAYEPLIRNFLLHAGQSEAETEHLFKMHLFEKAAYDVRDTRGLNQLIQADLIYSEWRFNYLEPIREKLEESAGRGDDRARGLLEELDRADKAYLRIDQLLDDAEHLVNQVLNDGAQAMEKLPEIERSRDNLRAVLKRERQRARNR